MEAAEAGGETSVQADVRFHRAVLAACHNDLVQQMGGLIGVGLLASSEIFARSYDTFLPMHRKVFEAISARRPEQARKTMAALLSSTLRFLERELGEADAGD